MAIASSNAFPSVLITEGTVPANPAAGQQRVYVDTADHKFKRVNSAGAVVTIEAGGGGSSFSWLAKTTTYTAVAGDFVLADAGGAAFTVTLPTAVGATALIAVSKKDSSANAITIATTSSQTIGGGGDTTKKLTQQDDTLLLASNGANWYIVASQMSPVTQLAYAPATDIVNGVSTTSNTWTDVVGNQTFSVDDAHSVVEITLTGVVLISTGGTAAIAIRHQLDSAGTPVNKQCGGAIGAGANYTNLLQGAGAVQVTGLAAGSHTIKLQAYSVGAAGTVYCRASGQAPAEFYILTVTERKRV